jgi:hypothetical protein
MMMRMNKTIFINKFIVYPPYNIWVWFGNRIWFGMSLYERYEGLEKVRNQLIWSFEKLKREHPEMVKDLDTK